MFPIAGFKAFWHPGANTFGIEIRLVDGRSLALQIETPEEFTAVLALLNGPGPTLTQQGHIISQS